MLDLTLPNVLIVCAGTLTLLLVLALQTIWRRKAQTPPPDVRCVPSYEFSGGWAFAETDAGREALQAFYGDPEPLYPFGGEEGYIVEPQDIEALLEFLRAEGIRWVVT